jgi:hypothetical protein
MTRVHQIGLSGRMSESARHRYSGGNITRHECEANVVELRGASMRYRGTCGGGQIVVVDAGIADYSFMVRRKQMRLPKGNDR